MTEDTFSLVLARQSESDGLEFKASFDPGSTAEWLEIIKDLVAIANSGGGCVLFGVRDDGQSSGLDVSTVLAIDPADVTNKVYKYTGHQFHGFAIHRAERQGTVVCAVVIDPSHVPIVFSKVGTYAVDGSKQKTAFSAGTVYFRHGAKSEPGNSDDLRQFLEREVEAIRKSWMEGIAKVVEAPTGSRVQILPPDAPMEQALPPVRLVADPSAPAFYNVPIDVTHPFRQKEVVEHLNKILGDRKKVIPFHVQCVRQAHHIDENPAFCYRQRYVSPRFSQALVDWIVEQYNANPGFFEDAKVALDERKRQAALSV